MISVPDVLKRIQTFEFLTWDVRYKKLSPYRCAANGYENIGYNHLKCEICQQELDFVDPYEDDYDFDKAREVVSDFETRMVHNHHNHCFFYKQPMLGNISLDYLYTHWNIHYSEFQRSFSNIKTFELPILSPKVKEYLTPRALHILFPRNSTDESIVINVPKVLAIFGWKYDHPTGIIDLEHPAYLRCDFCGRKNDIREYQIIKSELLNLDQEVGSTPGLIDSFDPLEEHKYFCKWGRSPTLAGNKDYGWKICADMLIVGVLKGKNGDQISIEVSGQASNPQEEKFAKDQAQFKLEIATKIQNLKKLKENTMKKFEEIVTATDQLQLGEQNRIENVLRHHKTTLEAIAKELEIRADPIKKIKPNES